MDLSSFAAGMLVATPLAAAAPGVVLYRTACALRRTRYAADHDGVAGCLSRGAFMRRAPGVITSRSGSVRAVALLDGDAFKAINDGYGHPAGDSVLRCLAARLQDRLGPGDLVARLGGDEFAVLAVVRGGGVGALGECLASVGTDPHWVGADAVRFSVSVGLAPVEEDADLAELLRRADAAMYRAKGGGLGVAVYNPVVDGSAVDGVEHPIGGARTRVRRRDLIGRATRFNRRSGVLA